ncbi:hypothetical protein GCM10007971_36900 [Oceanobacillus indicireducens]|uniref:Uncharacterized protein n=1 Tax=Oceanobacillus indicireducens TaxID=1004261 RepID=A0A917Y6D3_9BACI|nr:hypothetical protein GCM10007971_36900 [Oceanobacillus indicireducens]
MIVRDYNAIDETAWVRCQTRAFLQTAYFDNVLIFGNGFNATLVSFPLHQKSGTYYMSRFGLKLN